MHILAQFLLRLAFGLAVGMAITSSRQVTSGFFRNHLYVTLGLTTLAAIVLGRWSQMAMPLAAAAAILSYFGSAAWLYESNRLGKIFIWSVALFAVASALSDRAKVETLDQVRLLNPACVIPSGLVLGFVFAAMLLGHWYLNAPGMELAPLRRLLSAATATVIVQSLIVGYGLAAEAYTRSDVSVTWLLFVLLRWSFGLFGVLALLWMARRTLEIPNTQSATGILYVAVLGVFIGELTGLLLSAESAYPL
jgi:hypothetical protein